MPETTRSTQAPGDDAVDGGDGFDRCNGGEGVDTLTRCELAKNAEN